MSDQLPLAGASAQGQIRKSLLSLDHEPQPTKLFLRTRNLFICARDRIKSRVADSSIQLRWGGGAPRRA
jgi:hypothetical protein